MSRFANKVIKFEACGNFSICHKNISLISCGSVPAMVENGSNLLFTYILNVSLDISSDTKFVLSEASQY